MGRGYTMLPANVKPHVIAAMFNMETPLDGTEQGQTQVCTKVIVDQKVILYHVVTKHGSDTHGSDTRNGVWFHQTI